MDDVLHLRIIYLPFYIIMSSSPSATHVFNQYYFDFLKKLKGIAKAKKDSDPNATILRKAIKKHYSSYDRMSEEYRIKFQSFFQEWNEFASTDEWMTSEHTQNAMVYDGVTVANIVKLTNDPLTTGYFMIMFVLMSRALTEQDVSSILTFIRDGEATVFVHEDGMVHELVHRIKNIMSARTEKLRSESSQDETFKAMENTALGKLAKEILDEVNVAEIQDSIGDGDILNSLANPNSGITKLLGTVSQKMLSKMANGEIKHESLLQDAMKLASSIPGMGDLGAIGNIMKNFGGGNGGAPDLSGLGDLMKSFGLGGGMPKAPRSGPSSRVNMNAPALNQHMRRSVQAKQLRRKLEKQRKENVQGQVEDE